MNKVDSSTLRDGAARRSFTGGPRGHGRRTGVYARIPNPWESPASSRFRMGEKFAVADGRAEFRLVKGFNFTSLASKKIGGGTIRHSGNRAMPLWQEPGKSISLFSRTMNRLTNIWKLNLADKALTQVTFGPGPIIRPMPDPAGKGLYLVNGKSTGYFQRLQHAHETVHRHRRRRRHATGGFQEREENYVCHHSVAGPQRTVGGRRGRK